MPRIKGYGKGKRINIWIPERQIKTQTEIENFSKFVQIALDQVVGVMTWAILKERQPEQYHETGKIEDVVDKFNAQYPLNPLTKQRLENERTKRADQAESPQQHSELW